MGVVPRAGFRHTAVDLVLHCISGFLGPFKEEAGRVSLDFRSQGLCEGQSAPSYGLLGCI